MRAYLSKFTKDFVWPLLIVFIAGVWFGNFSERNRFYGDCRYSGVTRIGETAFKCEQFSKVVLLMPEEHKVKK